MTRKGISPLISVVLMIAVTVAVGGILGAWYNQQASESMDAVGDRGEQIISSSFKDIGIESAKIIGDELAVAVRNKGKGTLENVTVSVGLENGSVFTKEIPRIPEAGFESVKFSGVGGWNIKDIRVRPQGSPSVSDRTTKVTQTTEPDSPEIVEVTLQ